MKKSRIIKLIITLLLVIPVFGQNLSAQQETKSDARLELFCKSIDGVKGYKKLSKIAKKSMLNGQYDESEIVFKKMITEHPKKMNKNNVLDYYHSLLRQEKEQEIPNAGLSQFNHLPEVVRIIEMARAREIYTRESDMKRIAIELDIVAGNGVRYSNGKISFSIGRESDQKHLLYTSTFQNGQIGALKVVNDKVSSAISILSKQELEGKGRVYSIIPPKRLPDKIIIKSKEIPQFPYNSKGYSCSMPFYDETKQRLYFCSDMPGGYGGWDIYYCEQENNSWGEPILMGEQVNTVFDEIFPSVSKGSLIFSSDGLKRGQGGFDNYAYIFDENRTYNLINYNTPSDDYSLNIIHNKQENVTAVGISGNSIVYYQTIGVIEDEIELLANNKKEPDYLAEVSTNKKLKTLSYLNDFKPGTVFFDSNRSVIRNEFHSYLNNCLDSAYKMRSGLSLIIFAGADLQGEVNYNYLLSSIRANEVKRYLKNRDKESKIKDCIQVIMGESLKSGSSLDPEKRQAFVKGSHCRFPYQLILAVPKKHFNGLPELARVFQNSKWNLEMMNNILQEQYEDFILCGDKRIS